MRDGRCQRHTAEHSRVSGRLQNRTGAGSGDAECQPAPHLRENHAQREGGHPHRLQAEAEIEATKADVEKKLDAVEKIIGDDDFELD